MPEQIGQMYVNDFCHYLFFCMYHSLLFPALVFSFFFFNLYSHILIKENISPLDVTETDSCGGSRGENQPQDMLKSEISSSKIRQETCVCEGWEGGGEKGG